MKPARIALVGCGRIGVEADATAAKWEAAPLWIPLSHATAIKAVPSAELVALCDTDTERARAAASKLKVKAWFDDLENLLLEIQPDAVAVATRAAPRVSVIRKCIEYGVRGFFCEKPLCLNLEEADQIVRLLDEKGISFVYGTRRRYMPVYQRAREAFWNGEFGSPQQITLSFGLASLLWTHPHSIDLACFFARDAGVVSVEAVAEYPSDAYDGHILDADPLLKSAKLRFKNGVTALIKPSGHFDVELSGSEGVLAIEKDGFLTVRKIFTGKNSRLRGHRPTASAITITQKEASGTENSIKILVDSLRGKATTSSSIVLRNMEIIFGLAESILSGGACVCWPLKRRGLSITGRLNDLNP